MDEITSAVLIELRNEIRLGFSELRAEIATLRAEHRRDFLSLIEIIGKLAGALEDISARLASIEKEQQ